MTAATAPTTYRDVCGTHRGLQLHQEHSEPPCSHCVTFEADRLLLAKLLPELLHARPTPPLLAPISAEQAAHNLELLNEAMRTRDLEPCGTPAACRRHYVNGELPCQACLQAEHAYRAELRATHERLRHHRLRRVGAAA